MSFNYALNYSAFRKVQGKLILSNVNKKYLLSKLRVIILTALLYQKIIYVSGHV